MKNNVAVEKLIPEIKPYLRKYLEMNGVKFSQCNKFHCFSHDDKTASASVTNDGLTYKCFACDAGGDIISACNHFEGRAIQGKEFIDTLRHLADTFNVKHELDEQPVSKKAFVQKYIKDTEYIYTDLNNAPIYKIVKMVNPENKKDKKFFPYMYDKTKDAYNEKSAFSQDCKREIYHLVDVNKAIEKDEYVFFVEGEKCVEILRALGLTATCVVGGANAWKKPQSNFYVSSLCSARVIVLPDNDTAGRNFAEQVAKDIMAVSNLVKVITLEGLPPKGDIEQWLQLGGTKEKLLELCEKAKSFSAEKEFDHSQNVYIQDNKYFRVGKEFDKAISNFIIIPHECVEEQGTHYFFATAVTVNGKKFSVEFSSEVFINKSAFKKTFQNAFLSFTGNDEDLQAIKLLISAGDYDYKTGVKYIGLHKIQDRYIFVGNNKSLTSDNVEDNSTVLMPQYEVIKTAILDNEIIVQAEVRSTVRSLFNINSLDKTATIMGFVSACFFKAHFMEIGVEFPHLLIFGQSGSGKSQTLEKVINPFFSIGSEQNFGANQITAFTSMKICSSSNTIPFVIEEYKPGTITEKIRNMISSLLRNSYNNISGVRGAADQSMKTYSLINPIVLLGEEGINEPAILERSLELSFGKVDLTEDARISFNEVVHCTDCIKRLGKTVLLTALNTTPKTVMDIYKEVEEKVAVNKDIQTRIINNICVVVTGLMLLDKTLELYDESIESCTGYNMDSLMDAIISAVKANILSENGSSMSTVDRTIAIFDRMVSHGKLVKGVHYTFVKSRVKGREGKEELALDVSLIYDIFTKYINEYKVQSEVLMNVENFIKQLLKTEYLIVNIQKDKKKSSRTVRFKRITDTNQLEYVPKKAYCLDLEILREKIYLQNFFSDEFLQSDDEDEDNPFTNN